MLSRRSLLITAAAAGMLAAAPAPAAGATPGERARRISANGWPIDPSAIVPHQIQGSSTMVDLRQGPTAAVLLHVARRWHYEIAAIDTDEGGGVLGATPHRVPLTDFDSNYLSGTAIALYPTAFPPGGSERLWPHHEAIVRDILVDCAGTVVWGNDLRPRTASHFHVTSLPGDKTLHRVAGGLETSMHTASRLRTAGHAIDPAIPERRRQIRELPRTR